MTASDGQTGSGEFPNYGSAPVPPQSSPTPPVGAPTQNKKALWSMALGVTALLGLFCVIGGLLGGAAVALGLIGRSEITASGGRQTGTGMATAGVVTGLIAVVGALTMIILIAVGSSIDGTMMIN